MRWYSVSAWEGTNAKIGNVSMIWMNYGWIAIGVREVWSRLVFRVRWNPTYSVNHKRCSRP